MINMNEDQTTKPKRDYLLPASIFISALLVAGSLVWSVGKKAGSSGLEGNLPGALGNQPVSITLGPVSKDDHIFGNLDAPVKVIEFSDLECPFCKRFHPTMKQIVADYKGEVAWVYRHFPLDEIHSKARKEAEASECAAALGGNEKFWAFVDGVFAITPSNDGLDLSKLPQIAKDVGLDASAFGSCLDGGRYAEKVAGARSDALRAGAQGTPYSIVLGHDGKQYPINGALPYADVKAVIEQALK